MKYFKVLSHLFAVWLTIPCIMVLSCANRVDVAGEWQEIGNTGTLTLLKDGSFNAVDNQGMQVSGVFSLISTDSIRFVVEQSSGSREIISAKITLSDNRLTLSFEQDHETIHYGRKQ